MDKEKTPVTILQEMMAKMGKTPVYELCETNMETIPIIFSYKVSCDNLEATGAGRSKKDAKQNSASTMLEMLRKGKVVPKSLSKNGESAVQIMKFMNTCSSSTISSESSLDNYIQELRVLCSKYNLHEPIYKEMNTTGPEHARIYTSQCSMSTIFVTGTGKSKKLAKNNAAKAMVERVKDMFGTDTSSKVHGTKKQKLSNPDEASGYNRTMNDDVKEISKLKINYDLKMESERKVLSKNLKKILPNPLQKLEKLTRLVKQCQGNVNEENITMVKQEFQSLLKSAKIDFHHMLLQSMTSETFMLIIQLNTDPDILEMSLGTSREEAELRTIKKVIETLKIFLEIRKYNEENEQSQC